MTPCHEFGFTGLTSAILAVCSDLKHTQLLILPKYEFSKLPISFFTQIDFVFQMSKLDLTYLRRAYSSYYWRVLAGIKQLLVKKIVIQHILVDLHYGDLTSN